MRKLFITIAGVIFLALNGFAQQILVMPLSVAPSLSQVPAFNNSQGIGGAGVTDSSSIVINSPIRIEERRKSVYDVHWVTDCIKSGWTSADTTWVGVGLEACDTAYPFVMPVVGKLWRGCSSYHAGWDIGLQKGDPVVAGTNGIVRYARYCHGYGNLVIIRHFSGLEIYYAHLSKILVKQNQVIEAGDTVGLGGATGHARGYHLHMEFRVNDRALDIKDYLVQNAGVVNLYKIKSLSTPKAYQPKPGEAQYYTIVKGDNLSKIAVHYGTTVTSLCSLNGISKTSVLRIGQKLRVR
jgi:murein DD-endopeptidase MepM/ murein hydrolase activator NlpD